MWNLAWTKWRREGFFLTSTIPPLLCTHSCHWCHIILAIDSTLNNTHKIHYAVCTTTICSQPSGKEIWTNFISCLIFAAVRATPDTVCLLPYALYSFLPPISLWLLFHFILYTNCALFTVSYHPFPSDSCSISFCTLIVCSLQFLTTCFPLTVVPFHSVH